MKKSIFLLKDISADHSALDSSQSLVFVFFNQKLRDQAVTVKSHFPKSTVVGCSSAGEIFNNDLLDDSVVVSILKLEKSSFNLNVISKNQIDDDFDIGTNLAQTIDQSDLRGIILLTDGISVNGSKIALGLSSIIPKSIPISGGMAGDSLDFNNPLILINDKIVPGAALAVSFYGENLNFVTSAGGGWQPFGVNRMITKSKDNILYELNGRPALDLYKEYLGEESKNLPSSGLHYPLSVVCKSKNDYMEGIIRTVLNVDEASKFITFAGDMIEGSEVTFMQSSYENLVEASSDVAKTCLTQLNSGPVFRLAISCIGRRLVLGEYTEDEILAIKKEIPNLEFISGFYSYGEFGPHKNNNCELHNQSMTLILIQEN